MQAHGKVKWYAADSEGVHAEEYQGVAAAAAEMDRAQKRGWTVHAVSVNGTRLKLVRKPAVWDGFFGPRLAERRDGRRELRYWPYIPGNLIAVGLALAGSVAPMMRQDTVAVTYMKAYRGASCSDSARSAEDNGGTGGRAP